MVAAQFCSTRGPRICLVSKAIASFKGYSAG